LTQESHQLQSSLENITLQATSFTNLTISDTEAVNKIIIYPKLIHYEIQFPITIAMQPIQHFTTIKFKPKFSKTVIVHSKQPILIQFTS